MNGVPGAQPADPRSPRNVLALRRRLPQFRPSGYYLLLVMAKKIKTVAFVSLGCPKNLVDSERMLGLLAQDGLTITPDASKADAIVINTCGFLEASKTESL